MNFEKYIGIPYSEKGRDETGADCWGLVRLVYKNELNIDLPSFSAEYNTSDNERLEELFAQYKEGWESTEAAEVGDVVIFRIFGYESHIGICIGDNKFLHVREGRDSVIESLDNAKWSRRITGFFKYSEKKNAVLNTIPHPLRTERYTLAIAPGTTVTELVKDISTKYNIAVELKSRISILINGRIIAQEKWNDTVIKESDVIEYRAVPGKDTLRTLAILAVAFYAPQIAVGALQASATAGLTITATMGAAIYYGTYAAAMLVGSALINAIAPIRQPPQPKDPGSSERQLMVNGGSNRANPYGAIPIVLGKVRMTPLLGSQNFLTYENSRDSYVSMLLIWGYGPLEIDDNSYKIGNISIDNFTDIVKVNDGRITELPSYDKARFDGIYGKDITQIDTVSPLICEGNPESSVEPGPWFEAATVEQINPQGSVDLVSSVTLSFHFPEGLRAIVIKGGESGNTTSAEVNLELQFSTDDGLTWSALDTINYNFKDKDAFTTNKTYSNLNYDKMIVRVRRTNGDDTESNPYLRYYHSCVLQNVIFTRNTTPAVDPVGTKIAKTAFKIKATDQINGRLEGVSAVVQTYCKIWNGSAWVDGVTSNPAALMRYVLEHPANPKKITNASSQINLTQLQYFYNYCQTKGFEYNGVLGEARSVLEVIRDICAAGRASPALIDGKWSVVIDEPRVTVTNQPLIIQHFTPHNSWNFEGSKALPKRPDGLRVMYYDQDKDYQESEIIVYDINKDSTNAELFESITLPGVTKKSLVTDHAKWHMAQMKLRPEIYTLETDVEYLVCNRGDRVKVMHDVPMWGLASGRIKDRVTNLLPYSENLDIGWTNGTSATWQYESGIGPDGQWKSAIMWVGGLSGTGISSSGRTLYRSVSPVSTGNTYTFSVYVKARGSVVNDVRLRISQTTSNSTVSSNFSVGSEWTRITVTRTMDSSNSTVTCLVGTGGSVSDLYIFGAQFEIGSQSTEYISNPVAVLNQMLYLDEDVPMKADVNYTMRVRSKTGGSITRTVVPKVVDGYYSSVVFTTNTLQSEVDVNDLFLFGELNQESQDLIVLSIEPSNNKTARITMVDYGVTNEYNIFTDYLTLSADTVFESQITLPPVLQVEDFGNKIPTITGFVSDESVMEKVSKSVFRYNINVGYFNASQLPDIVESVQIQYDLPNSEDNSTFKSIFVPFEKGSGNITDVTEGETYKVRMRYVARNGKVGNWTDYSLHTVVGKKNPPSTPTGFTAAADSSSGQIRLSWNSNPEVDTYTYEVRTTASNWGVENSDLLFIGDSTNIFVKYITGSNTYYLKAIDSSGNYSLEYSEITFTPLEVSNVSSLDYSFYDTSLTNATVILTWNEVIQQEFDVSYYELSYLESIDQEIIKTVKGNTLTLPANWLGSRVFTIKTVNINNEKSSGFSLSVLKEAPNPPTSYRAQVIDNNVLLYWKNGVKTSLPISHVLIKRSPPDGDWDSATIIGTKSGEFTSISELSGGNYIYWLAAVDTDNNESIPIEIPATVSQPPDFKFTGELSATLNGTYSNSVKYNSEVILPVNTTETWQEHFDDNSWTGPSSQVSAGYPFYVQPGLTSGYYEEIFDYGEIISSVQITLNLIQTDLIGSTKKSATIYTSSDNITYTEVGAYSGFGSNFRYIKITLRVEQISSASIAKISDIRVRLDSKQRTESGSTTVPTTGKIVNFENQFNNVQSIILTPSGNQPVVSVSDFNYNLITGTYSVTSGVATINAASHELIAGQQVKLYFTSGLGISGLYIVDSVINANSYTVNMPSLTVSTTGNVGTYPNSMIIYSFTSNTGVAVESLTSYQIRGY